MQPSGRDAPPWRPPPAVAARLQRLRVAAGGLGERLQASAAQAGAALQAARAAHLQARADAATAAAELPPMEPLPGDIPALQLPPPSSGSAAPAAASLRDPAARLAAFHAALAPPRVDLPTLRALTLAGGVPEDVPGLRITVWQLLLSVLPLEPDAWPAARRQQRAAYRRLVRELVVDPSKETAAADPAADHPLALDKGTSAWARHFEHAETREQIGRDVERTQRDMHWFSADGAAAHRAAIARALFIFAATNQSVRYVQGMNELMAPLYYLCATAPAQPGDEQGGPDGDDDDDDGSVSAAEAAAFHCFVPLLGELRDLFCASLDGSAGGVAGAMASLSALLAAADAELAEHLERRCGVNPQYYAFRWITTALTQEFLLPDALRAWDGLLADPSGPRDALVRAAAAMVLHLRPQLLAGDFAANLKLLQAFPPSDVGAILRTAAALPRGVASLASSAEGGTENAWGGGGGGGGLGAAGLRPNLKPPASWAARRGLGSDEPWVHVVLAPP